MSAPRPRCRRTRLLATPSAADLDREHLTAMAEAHSLQAGAARADARASRAQSQIAALRGDAENAEKYRVFALEDEKRAAAYDQMAADYAAMVSS